MKNLAEGEFWKINFAMENLDLIEPFIEDVVNDHASIDKDKHYPKNGAYTCAAR